MTTENAPTYTLCCIVDDNPRFYVELVLWALCVKSHLPSNRFHSIIYEVGNTPPDLIKWVLGQGIEVRKTSTLINESRHCNKILPFLEDHSTDFTIVCDTDLFFLNDPSSILRSDRFRAAPNNHCNPPAHIFQSLMAVCGLGRPYRPGISLFSGYNGQRETHLNNISAGIVVSPKLRSKNLGLKWKKWAQWLVENRYHLGKWSIHVDQVAFALALEELQEDVEFLPPQANTILHLFMEISTCFAVHLTTGHIPSFPHFFNSDRTLKTEGLSDGMVATLARLNFCIREATGVILELESTRKHWDKFLNPLWRR